MVRVGRRFVPALIVPMWASLTFGSIVKSESRIDSTPFTIGSDPSPATATDTVAPIRAIDLTQTNSPLDPSFPLPIVADAADVGITTAARFADSPAPRGSVDFPTMQTSAGTLALAASRPSESPGDVERATRNGNDLLVPIPVLNAGWILALAAGMYQVGSRALRLRR